MKVVKKYDLKFKARENVPMNAYIRICNVSTGHRRC